MAGEVLLGEEGDVFGVFVFNQTVLFHFNLLDKGTGLNCSAENVPAKIKNRLLAFFGFGNNFFGFTKNKKTLPGDFVAIVVVECISVSFFAIYNTIIIYNYKLSSF